MKWRVLWQSLRCFEKITSGFEVSGSKPVMMSKLIFSRATTQSGATTDLHLIIIIAINTKPFLEDPGTRPGIAEIVASLPDLFRHLQL